MDAKPITPELKKIQDDLESDARKWGLDFFDIVFQIHDYKSISELIAYSGMPIRYPHWTFGKEHMIYRYQYDYGQGKVYEMVINNDPSIAYLMADNPLTTQKMVIGHVIAHVDFFKNNRWFSKTSRNAVLRMARDADMIRGYAKQYGDKRIEDVIDMCRQIDNLIDPLERFRLPMPEGELETFDPMAHVKPWMEDWVLSPEERERYEKIKNEVKDRENMFPQRPVKDVLGFLLEHAPKRNRLLKSWQVDILRTIRDDAYYFAPQGMTKIMNEGWASYWHFKFMAEMGHAGMDGIVDFALKHAAVLGTAPWQPNPYQIGLNLLEFIEDKWNKGKHGIDYEQCRSVRKRREWDTGDRAGLEKLFEVRKFYDDFLLINEFFDQEFADKYKYYKWARDPETGMIYPESKDHRFMKYSLLSQIDNRGNPYIYVQDGDYRNKGQLLLYHAFDGRILDMRWARPVMESISKIWGNDVHLLTFLSSKEEDDEYIPAIITCQDGGEKFFAQWYDPDKDKPEGEKMELG